MSRADRNPWLAKMYQCGSLCFSLHRWNQESSKTYYILILPWFTWFSLLYFRTALLCRQWHMTDVLTDTCRFYLVPVYYTGRILIQWKYHFKIAKAYFYNRSSIAKLNMMNEHFTVLIKILVSWWRKIYKFKNTW